MLSNYLKTSIRNLLRHKGYSFINVIGLTIGLAASIFILLWVLDEWSYDRFHSKADRIYQVVINHTLPDGTIHTYSANPAKLKPVIVDQIPEVELAVQYSMDEDQVLKYESAAYHETGIYADPTLFSVLDFPIVNGNLSNPLPDSRSIAISEDIAEKLFRNEDPLGKSLLVGSTQEYIIGSVFANIPSNSSLQFDYVIPFETYIKENPWTQNWKSGGTRTLVLLEPGSSLNATNAKLADLINSNCEDCTESPFLFPITKSRLYSEFSNGHNVGGRIQQVYLFSGIAILILIIACINFMNLSTARSATRSREVGVRKSIGAKKSGLVFQFMMESILQSFMALILALAIVQLLLPFFNAVTSKSIQMDLNNPLLITAIFGITVFSGLLAGSYPALFLSRFNPVNVLKGNTQFGSTGGPLRKTLVVAQFAISVILVIGSIAIYKQITFIGEKNLGFNKDNVIVIDQTEEIRRNFSAIRNDLNQMSNVEGVAFGGNNIFTIPINTTDPIWNGKPDNSSISFKIYRCDADFIPIMNIQMVGGRNFMDNRDASNYIVNQKALEIMGLSKEEAIGASLEMWNGKGEIVGITDDFHNDNLKFGIEPLIFMYSEDVGAHYFIRLSEQAPITASLQQVEKAFNKHAPDSPFEYSFLDDVFEKEYKTEAVTGKLALSFTVIAILISCLGLFGLASFTAERRTKELGLRKIMGASVSNLVLMLLRDFSSLIIFSLIIGFPISWILVNQFLSGYAFHTEITFGIYLITVGIMFLITVLSVGYQSGVAATSNPVDSLRSE